SLARARWTSSTCCTPHGPTCCSGWGRSTPPRKAMRGRSRSRATTESGGFSRAGCASWGTKFPEDPEPVACSLLVNGRRQRGEIRLAGGARHGVAPQRRQVAQVDCAGSAHVDGNALERRVHGHGLRSANDVARVPGVAPLAGGQIHRHLELAFLPDRAHKDVVAVEELIP